jgi:hypothetical protein
MMPLLSLLLLLTAFSAGSAQEDCHGQACAAAGSASMLQTQIRDHYEARSLSAMNSSYSSTLFVHTKENKDLFMTIATKGLELKQLLDAFLKSDFMTSLCSETPITGGDAWDCDPSKVSASDLEDLLGRLNNTVMGQEAVQHWREIVALVQKPMTWINEIMNEWLPKLKQIVNETLGTLKESGIEDYFDAKSFDVTDLLQLFTQLDGKYGLTRFFEATAYVAEELDASKVVSEMLDNFAELFTKLQAAIMALQGKAFDFLKEKTLMDALASVKTELDAFFAKVKSDFLDFGESKAFLEDPANRAVWEGQDILTLGGKCTINFDRDACNTLITAAGHSGKVSIAWQAIRILNEVMDSNTRLLQVSEPSVEKHIQKSVSTSSPNSDQPIGPEATRMRTEMDAVDAEIKAKAPDLAFVEPISAFLPGSLGTSTW